MRIFVDSSVFFAMADSEAGAARELVRRAIQQEIELVVSDFVIEETERNLGTKRAKALELFGYFRAVTLHPDSPGLQPNSPGYVRLD